MNQELFDAINRCGEWLKGECIKQVGSTHVFSDHRDVRRWTPPPVLVSGEIAGVEMQRLVHLLYSPDPVPLDTITACWAMLMPLVNGHKAAHKRLFRVLRQAFPDVPFVVPDGLDVRACLVQYLVAASWHTGKLKLSPHEAVLTVAGRLRLAVYHQAVEWLQGYRRTRSPINFWPSRVARMGLGITRLGLTDTGAACRHLMEYVPEHRDTIHTLFTVAVYAGREAEQQLVRQFDVERRGDPADVDNADEVANLLQFQQQLIGAAR